MTRKIFKLTAPSHWASYLINGDASGMSGEDLSQCNGWLEEEFGEAADAVDCEDAGFRWRHDASRHALAADCQTYTFLVEDSDDPQE